MAVEALQAELAAAGILKRCAAVELQQCVAGISLAPPDPQQPPPWLAVRSALLATCVLPLACAALHARCAVLYLMLSQLSMATELIFQARTPTVGRNVHRACFRACLHATVHF